MQMCSPARKRLHERDSEYLLCFVLNMPQTRPAVTMCAMRSPSLVLALSLLAATTAVLVLGHPLRTRSNDAALTARQAQNVPGAALAIDTSFRQGLSGCHSNARFCCLIPSSSRRERRNCFIRWCGSAIVNQGGVLCR